MHIVGKKGRRNYRRGTNQQQQEETDEKPLEANNKTEEETIPCEALEQEFDKGVKQLMMVSGSIEERLKHLAKRQAVWDDLDKKIEENFAKVPSKVVLDVGGKLFATSKDTLVKLPDTYFYALFSRGQWKPDANGTYFIDRNPKFFGLILDFMRYGTIDLADRTAAELKMIYQELDYYQLRHHLSGGFDSILLLEHAAQVSQWVGIDKQWVLAYRASRDGFDAASFHRHCDNKGESIVIASANGYLFGAYSPTSWSSNGQYTANAATFLFTLTNPYKIPPTKFPNTGSHSTYGHASYGPTFGSGHDLSIYDKTVSFGFPSAFRDSTGRGGALFTGGTNAQLTDYEVFLRQ